MDDFEMGRMDEDKEFYIAPIKAAVLAKKGELAADKAAKAKKPEACPICGGKMPGFLTPEVKDGYICDYVSANLTGWKKTAKPTKPWKIIH